MSTDSTASSDAREKLLPRVTINEISYSEKYADGKYEYRHVICPTNLGKKLKALGLLSENEWRKMGVQQSAGWEHYTFHDPEPHILLFRRKLPEAEVKDKN